MVSSLSRCLPCTIWDGSQTKDVDWTDFEKAALAGDLDKIMIFSQNGIAEGFLTEQGAKNQKFDMTPQMTGEKKIKTTIPSTDKIQDKIDGWNDKARGRRQAPDKDHI